MPGIKFLSPDSAQRIESLAATLWTVLEGHVAPSAGEAWSDRMAALSTICGVQVATRIPSRSYALRAVSIFEKQLIDHIANYFDDPEAYDLITSGGGHV